MADWLMAAGFALNLGSLVYQRWIETSLPAITSSAVKLSQLPKITLFNLDVELVASLVIFAFILSSSLAIYLHLRRKDNAWIAESFAGMFLVMMFSYSFLMFGIGGIF